MTQESENLRIPSPSLRLRDRALAWAVSWAGWAVIQAIGRTSRLHAHYHPAARRAIAEGPVIYAFWHRYQILMAYEKRGCGALVLVSRSRDGELIARVVERFGLRTARGSSSRGGGTALRELLDGVRSGRSAAFTPDGPRGPFRSVQPGVLALAEKTGAPIVPLAWAGSRVKELSSWDRFLIPLPFGRYEVVFGEPLRVGGEAEAADRLRESLDAAAREAERLLAEPHPALGLC